LYLSENKQRLVPLTV